MAGDEKLILEVDLNTGSVDQAYSDVSKKGEQTAKDVEQAFNKSLQAINTKALVQVNNSLENLNKNLEENTKAQNQIAESTNNITGVFSNIVTVTDFVIRNYELILTASVALGKVSKDLADKVSDVISSFQGLSAFDQGSLNDFLNALGNVLGDLGILDDILIALAPTIFTLAKRFGFTGEIIKSVGAQFKGLGAAVGVAGATVIAFTKTARDLGRTVFGVGNVLLGNTRNIFGLTTALATTAVGLGAVSESLKRSNNEFLRFTGVLSATASILLGGFAAAITIAIVGLGKLAFNVGTALVERFQAATLAFAESEKSLAIFNKTIETFNRISKGALLTTAEWTGVVDRLSDQFNISQVSLRKAAAEIITVGTRIGLTARQQEQLLEVTAEYAKVTGKDVFDASVAFVSGLNGQSQALVSYGVKLNEASNQQFILKQGFTDTFRELAESEKTQVRFNNLLGQYEQIAGLGAATTGTLAEASDRLNVKLNRLSTAVGKGAAIIEQNNIVAFAANQILDQLGENTIAVTGFLGALGARTIQITGFFLEWSFKIFAVTKGIAILNVLLKSSTLQSSFGKSIPLLNISLKELLATIGIGGKNIKSFGGLIRGLGTAVLANLATIPKALGSIIATFGRLLFAASPVILAITAIIAVFKVLKDAFVAIEREAQAFSELFTILNDILFDGGSIFTSLKDAFVGFGNFLKTSFNKLVGASAFALSKLVQAAVLFAENDPFETISRFNVGRLQGISKRLDRLNDQLVASGFEFDKFAKRAVASGDAIKDLEKPVNLEALAELRRELADVGKSDLKLLIQERDSRLNLLQRALNQELLTTQQFEENKQKVLTDFAIKRQELRERENKDLLNSLQNIQRRIADAGKTELEVLREQKAEEEQILRDSLQAKLIDEATFRENLLLLEQDFADREREILEKRNRDVKQFNQILSRGLANLLSQGIQTFTNALLQGEDAFEALGKSILGILGDLAIQLGQFLVVTGIGQTALLSLPGGSVIAAGLGLIALGTVLKSLGGPGFAGVGGPIGSGVPEGGGFVGGVEPETGTIAEGDIEEKTTEVKIEVAGTVLDPVSVGNQIAQVLNESFEAGGTKVVLA